MFSFAVALFVLGAIGFALGRAPLFRALVAVLAMLVYLPIAAFWITLLFGLFDLEHRAREWGWSDGRGLAILALVPPAAIALPILRWLGRRPWPRFLWRRRDRPGLLPFRAILLVQALVVGAWIVAGNAVASSRERDAEKAWAAADPSLLGRRAAKAGTNAAGHELARRAAKLGIEVGRDLEKPTAEDRKIHERVRQAVSSFAWTAVSQRDDRLPQPPLEVRAWLAIATEGLEAVERQLAEGDAVVWEVPDGWAAYPMLGIRDLHSALVAAVLERVRTGDGDVERGLAALWGLTASLRDRPDTLSRLLATAQDRQLVGLLRLAGSAPAPWEKRLGVLDDGVRPLGATGIEALSLVEIARRPLTTARGMFLETKAGLALLDGTLTPFARFFMGISGGGVSMETFGEAVEAERARARTSLYRYVPGPLERPYLRLCAAERAAAECEEYSAVLAENACTDAERPRARRPPFWSLAGDSSSFLHRLARSVAVLRAEAELTGLVLGARAGRPFATAPVSRACPGRHWTEARSEDGAVTLRLDPNPFGEKEATVEFRMSGR